MTAHAPIRPHRLAEIPRRLCVKAGQVGDALVRVRRAGSADALHWPYEGQASVRISGIGSLGTVGTPEPVPIASITKAMTAFTVLQRHPLTLHDSGPSVRIDALAAAQSESTIESVVRVREGQEFPLRTLLEFLLVPSGNNIARLLARWSAGSEAAFVARMNRTAAELGMTRTTFTGSCGMDPGNRSTAPDLLRLAEAAMHDEVFRAVVTTASVPLPDGTTGRTTNRLLGRDGVIGLKTGTTTPAGGNVLWAATVDVDGVRRLALGAVLAQRPGRSPVRARAAVWAHTHRMIRSIHSAPPGALASALAPVPPPVPGHAYGPGP
ncbi:D-alanyl-D-alanine carboxypeptidase family protein, partial [Streptomyces sp. NPDC057411]